MNAFEVAVPTPIHTTFTYLAEEEIPRGVRVLVPFGSRKVVGVVLGPSLLAVSADKTVLGSKEGQGEIRLKSIAAVIDEVPVYSATTLEIARWLSVYYLHPLGEVLRAMLPASATKVVKESYLLTDKAQDLIKTENHELAAILKDLFKKRSSIQASTLAKRLKALAAAEVAPFYSNVPSLKALLKEGFLTKSRGTSMRARSLNESSPSQSLSSDVLVAAAMRAEQERPLTPQQTLVYEAISQQGLRAQGYVRPFLLHGVTGAGKTEIYLRLIREILLEQPGGAQALIMVPEISLTPQMTRVFESRFPGLVAVVHSAMTDAARWEQLERVRCGLARILIGPRSAVFGPFQRLRLIVVDEEHDGSYKQATGLTYHGRDIAVLRAKLEGATVVLGSATPSMESYYNAQQGKYGLLELPERVTGRPLPEIELIEGGKKGHRQGALVHKDGYAAASRNAGKSDDFIGEGADNAPIDERIIAALRENLRAGHQAIVLVNRRGYAYYLFSLEEKKAVQCPHCSISLTLHAKSTVLRCHYCDYRTTLTRVAAERPNDTLVAVGYGSEKAEDCLKQLLPEARIVRLDSDTVVKRDALPQALSQFRAGEIDILVGTQILAKGHDFPNVTLIAILEVDQLLGLPDFRAGERTFQLIVQAAGRAGRAELPGRVLIQTMRGAHPIVISAFSQDYKAFAKREMSFRQAHAYPPFSRMIALEFNSPERQKLSELCERMERWFDQMSSLQPQLFEKVRVLGPAVPPIETIRGRHRRSVIFSSAGQEALRPLVQQFLSVFQKLPADMRLKIDVDPQSLI